MIKQFVQNLVDRLLGRKRAIAVVDPVVCLLEKRASVLENSLMRCGLSRRCAKRVTMRIMAENPDFDLFSPRFAGIRYTLEAIASDFQNAFDFLLAQEEERAYEWLSQVYQGSVVFVPSLFYDF